MRIQKEFGYNSICWVENNLIFDWQNNYYSCWNHFIQLKCLCSYNFIWQLLHTLSNKNSHTNSGLVYASYLLFWILFWAKNVFLRLKEYQVSRFWLPELILKTYLAQLSNLQLVDFCQKSINVIVKSRKMRKIVKKTLKRLIAESI